MTSGTTRRLLGDTGPLVLARFGSAALTFCIPLVLARVLDLTEYGTYKQFFLIAQTLYYVLPAGMPQALYFFLPRVERARAYLVQTLLFLLLIAGGMTALLVAGLIGPVARYFSNPALTDHAVWLVLFVIGLMGSSPLEVCLTAQGRLRQAAACYLISDAVRAAVLIVPALLHQGLRGMMIALAVFSLLRLAFTWVALLRTTSGPFWDPEGLRAQLRYAAPFGAAILLAIPQQNAHQYAVSASVTPALFAIYAAGCFQVPLVEMLYNPTSEVLMVQLGELERTRRAGEGTRVFTDAVTRLALCFVPLAALLLVVAPDLTMLLFGPRFVGAAPIFRVGLVATVLAILPVDGVLRATNQTRHIFLSYLVKAAVTVPLLWFGMRWLGLMGGILAWAVAECIGKAVLMARVPRALGIAFREVLPWTVLGRVALTSVTAALVLLVLRRAGLEPAGGMPTPLATGSRLLAWLWKAGPLCLQATLFGLIYVGGLLALGRGRLPVPQAVR
jgi:O-antigen/teichoic acid export membrane protein